MAAESMNVNPENILFDFLKNIIFLVGVSLSLQGVTKMINDFECISCLLVPQLTKFVEDMARLYLLESHQG